jgi:hypothetical protein
VTTNGCATEMIVCDAQPNSKDHQLCQIEEPRINSPMRPVVPASSMKQSPLAKGHTNAPDRSANDRYDYAFINRACLTLTLAYESRATSRQPSDQ